MTNKFESEIARITQEKDDEITALTNHLEKTTATSQKNRHVELTLLDSEHNTKNKFAVFDAWKQFTKMKKRENYCESARSDNQSKGVERRVFIAWRTITVLLNHRRESNRRLYEVQQAKASCKLDIADEMETLKTMLIDLTEDLR